MHISSISKVSEMRAAMVSQFNVLVVFLVVMALILAFVGSLGLAGTMSLNVLERIREIGVMRAIGASNFAILQIFLIEGVLIGLISWLLGLVVSWPMSRALSDVVGVSFLQTPLDYAFSGSGAILWLVAVIVLSILASILPAMNATRITVRDVLAYE
jgi:putative ABC transport system permease protein